MVDTVADRSDSFATSGTRMAHWLRRETWTARVSFDALRCNHHVMLAAILVALLVVFVVLPLLGLAVWLVISTVVVGLILGALGRLVVPGKQRIGIFVTILIGVTGSFVGSILGHVFGVGGLLTLLLQIGVSAGLVALATTGGRRAITR